MASQRLAFINAQGVEIVNNFDDKLYQIVAYGSSYDQTNRLVLFFELVTVEDDQDTMVLKATRKESLDNAPKTKSRLSYRRIFTCSRKALKRCLKLKTR